MNGNGVQDAGEPGLAGWTIQLVDAAGNVIDTTISGPTDAAGRTGRFCFNNVPAGSYTVQEVAQTGWVQTLPTAPGTYSVTVGAGTAPSSLLFGNMQSPGSSTTVGSSICGSKFNDVNGNGVQEPGEPYLPGWTIQLLDAAGNVVDTTMTSTETAASPPGRFCFNNVKTGSYTVQEVAQTGWVQTLPTAPGTYSVTVGAGTAPSTLLFGNMQSPGAGTICGIKFEDKNGNGQQDPGEVGMGGWTIQVMDAAGNVVATVVTRDDGTYCFRGLRPGVYTFGEVMQDGYQQTFPGTPGTQTVKVVGGQNTESIDFGNQKKPDPCCLSFPFLQGRADNFATADGAEPTQPSAALVQTIPAAHVGFDVTVGDRFVAHTFTLPAGNCVQSASLEFKAKPLGGNPDNDSVSLRFVGVPGSPVWGAYLGAGMPSTGLLASAWYLSNYSAGNVFSLDLANLPGGANLISTLNAQRFVDFVVQDDTSVDYVLLTVKFCECSSPSEPVDDNVNQPKQLSVIPGVSLRLVLDSSEATVNGEAVRLPTPAVLRDGSTMVPLRWIGEALGAEVQWDMTERRATYMLGELKVELWIDKRMARVNGEDVALSIAPTLIDGSTFVPLRFLGEAFGLTVEYDPDDRSIRIFDRWGNL